MTDTMTMAKADLVAKASADMARHLGPSDWTEPQKVALTCRILFAQGHDSGLAGQITARADEPGTFHTQRLGLGFDEIAEDNLLVVDEDLTVLAGDGMANPANRFHAWVYRARPSTRCIVHTHPPHLCALGMLGRPLVISQMDACLLYDDVAFLPRWPGIPVGNEEGELIAGVLGAKRAALLGHHGVIVAGDSVEEACVLAIQAERAARLQLLAEAAGTIRPIDPTLGREAHDWLLQESKIRATFAYYARRALRGPVEAGPPPIGAVGAEA